MDLTLSLISPILIAPHMEVLSTMSVRVLPTIDRLPQALRRFMDRLTEEQKLLLVLKRDLYDNKWEPMLQDLESRLKGKPYVFKLANRIEDDLKRIAQIRELEQHYEVDLTDFIETLEQMETGSCRSGN